MGVAAAIISPPKLTNSSLRRLSAPEELASCWHTAEALVLRLDACACCVRLLQGADLQDGKDCPLSGTSEVVKLAMALSGGFSATHSMICGVQGDSSKQAR